MARLGSEAFPFREAGAVSHRAAGPNRTFIKMGKKLRADRTAESEEHRHQEAGHSNAYGYPAVGDGLADRFSVPVRQRSHDWVMPFLHSLAKQPTAENRRDKNRVGHGPKKCKRYGPGHRFE